MGHLVNEEGLYHGRILRRNEGHVTKVAILLHEHCYSSYSSLRKGGGDQLPHRHLQQNERQNHDF
jgi:hypothetical protein